MKKATCSIFLLLFCFGLRAQINTDTVQAGLFDNGKMWTFDFPPTDYFEKTYHFKPTPEWFDAVRLSALRFATYCSASFVSPDGLIMTNHHCARESGTAVQRPGEDFAANGFYAQTLQDERKVPGLFVDQLVKIEDITTRVQQAASTGKTDADKAQLKEDELDKIQKEYADKDDWKGLTLQPMTFYQGGKYALYGFKRYNDVRLVAMPELALGFFGGDNDNFTYPRYCLDFSFFRVYDDNGQPYHPKYYFKFNPDGIKDGEPVFVVGNPGSTNRQATVAILKYYRDTVWPALLQWLQDRSDAMSAYNATAHSDSLVNTIFEYNNSIKAYSGELDGLRDPYIFARREAFEKSFKNAVAKMDQSGTSTEGPQVKSPLDTWQEIQTTQEQIAKIFDDVFYFSPNRQNSDAYDLSFDLAMYARVAGDTSRSNTFKQDLEDYTKPMDASLEKALLADHLKEVEQAFGDEDPYVKAALDGKTPAEAAETLYRKTDIYSAKFRDKLVSKGSDAIGDSKDPMVQLATMALGRFINAVQQYRQLNDKLDQLRSSLGLLLFDVYGTSIPPDATFSLRIADGVVKGYDYNGTKAPINTTFYGLYDRYYSFHQKDPWNLPSRWLNPPMDLLKQPLDLVATNDIIGGNSGSPLINENREVVGLIFDGNMESLPGDYIYLPEKNRSIAVHAGGIIAGLKYIYKADRLVNELLGN